MTSPQSETGSIGGATNVSNAAPTETAPAKAGDGKKGKTLTQEAVNALIKERVERAEASATNKLLQDLGIGSVDDLKSLVTNARKTQDANKTELEKAQEKLAQTQSDLADREQRRIKVLIKSAVELEAAKLNFWKPEQAIKLIDLTKIEVGEDDTVKGVEEAMQELAEQNKHLIKTNGKPSLGATNPAGVQAGEPDIIKQMKSRLGQVVDTSVFSNPGGGVLIPPSGE